ncbi:putative ascorbate peroxidase [Watersipora subatra]|uniref:putative ascorbate peroxidase n=1 Tax=Watersipora subatra TaxID=2589382 RepID=UPI00355C639F
MNLKLILTGLLVMAAFIEITDARSRRINCNNRRSSRRRANESRRDARQRRQEERCLCNPGSARCRVPPVHTSQPEVSLSSLRRSMTAFLGQNSLRRIPGTVRLVYHSCVGNTGCDGCINSKTMNNLGLMTVYYDAISLWKKLGRPIGLADFIVLLGTVSVETAFAQPGGPGRRQLPFRTGRRSCSDPINYNLDHVFAMGQNTDSVEFLMGQFGLTRKLAIALLGAHSLGRCNPETSGFFGPWDNTQQTLDNAYYLALMNGNWRLVDSSNGFTQWIDGGKMMLHADMTLLRNLRISNDETPSCRLSSQCPFNRANSRRVENYAQNQNVWADDFVRAFLKMVEH